MKYLSWLTLSLTFTLSLSAFAQQVSCQRAAVRKVGQVIGQSLKKSGADHLASVAMSQKIYNAHTHKEMLVEVFQVSINNAETAFFHADVAYPTYRVTTTLVDGRCSVQRNLQAPYDFIPSATETE